MVKLLMTLLIFLMWYLFSGFYIAEKDSYDSWIYGLLLYLIGLFWVIPFVLRRTMYTPYAGDDLDVSEQNKWKRLLFFGVGLLLCITTSVKA